MSKVNKKGRNTGGPPQESKPKDDKDPFYLAHTRPMKRSPAWRAAPDHCRRALDRLELEHLNHGLQQNGKLCVTYDNFVEAGIPRAAVRLAIVQAVHLGFVEITRRGNGRANLPNLFRLTYAKQLAPDGKKGDPETDEWQQIETDEQAKAALRSAEDEVIREREQLRERKAARVAAKSVKAGEKSPERRAM